MVPTLAVPGLFGRAKLCCGCPDGTEVMCSGLCRLRMAAMPSWPLCGGRMSGPCLHGATPPLVASELAGLRKDVCALFFVFYHLIFLSLEIGRRDNLPPRSVLTLQEWIKTFELSVKISSLDTF